ncbi:MAG: multiheme c-type cytochrome [Candidatus Pelagadaptatus aseana]|uniref:multiheme c-type cytochrome n=1 Tax=Candidatus Pelagadaptatus aseana TaxID=3120508 RepID=UPI0039B33064
MNLPRVLFFISLLFAPLSLQASELKYMGTESCAGCHEQEYKLWQGSHHDMSMRHAREDAVQGDFDNVEFDFNGEANRFYRQGKEYWVNIKGPTGQFNDYQIKYTFGYTPLQQYMVEFEDGRVQLIPFAWDSRPQAEGGQRWFHLYPEFTDSREEFFWTNTGQNWNYMCADCHSTNLEKNYDLNTNTYNTTFSEINVGCEACHGPASGHMDWLNNKDGALPHKGFDRTLAKAVNNWLAKEGQSTLSPEKIEHTQQTQVCAQCHSRHVQISEKDHVKSDAFGDRYMLSLINRDLYHADGQIYDEVFVYGSFLQSKMSRSGVTCTNCHNPHSNELIIPIESVCLQCHQADQYAVKDHHQHPLDSAGAQCVSCHMPATTYMQVDPRRDHGWHVPRPDMSQQLGTPDTCLSCHQDKDSQWSSAQVAQWHPDSEIREEKHFAPVFSAIDAGYMQAASALSHVAQNKLNAPIIRASAIERMTPLSDNNSLVAIARGAKDPDEFIRLAAARGGAGLGLNERWRVLSPLLQDKVLAVRMEAAVTLASLWPQLSAEQQAQLQPALDEYLLAQEFNYDRGFSHNNIGTVHAYQGNDAKAIEAFKTAIKIEPNSSQAYMNLAELYRRGGGSEDQVVEVLTQGARAVVRNSAIYYRLGLANIRAAKTSDAVASFANAIKGDPNNAQYHYVMGLTLEKSDTGKAMKSLRQAYDLGGDPRHLFALCDMQVRYQAFNAAQCINELSAVAPPEVVDRLRSQLSAGQGGQ